MTVHIDSLMGHQGLRREPGQSSCDGEIGRLQGFRLARGIVVSVTDNDLLTSCIVESMNTIIETGRGIDKGSTPGPPRIASRASGGKENSAILRSNSLMVEYRGGVAVSVRAIISAMPSQAKRKPHTTAILDVSGSKVKHIRTYVMNYLQGQGSRECHLPAGTCNR